MSIMNRMQLTFVSNLGEDIVISIPKAKTNLNSTDATALANRMIANGGIFTTNGVPASLKNVTLIATERDKLM